jgi:hypothetical protein
MNRKPNRRWLRYSIRTLLVAVTIVCVWLGWQWRIVQERKAVIRLVVERGAFSFPSPDPDEPCTLSWIRQVLGDKEVIGSLIVHERLSQEEKDRIAQAYPDNRLIVWPELEDNRGDEIFLIY